MSFQDWLLEVRSQFPLLTEENSRPTSPADETYNCIAWAANDSKRWWWPDAQEQDYWPTDAPRVESIDAFIFVFERQGFMERSDSTLEPGKQKIAIFANPLGKPTHATRQRPDGWWASKLGLGIDIEHDLLAIEGPVYGNVAVVLARRLPSDGDT